MLQGRHGGIPCPHHSTTQVQEEGRTEEMGVTITLFPSFPSITAAAGGGGKDKAMSSSSHHHCPPGLPPSPPPPHSPNKNQLGKGRLVAGQVARCLLINCPGRYGREAGKAEEVSAQALSQGQAPLPSSLHQQSTCSPPAGPVHPPVHETVHLTMVCSSPRSRESIKFNGVG